MKNYWLSKNFWQKECTETAVYATVNKGLFTLEEEPKRTDIVRISRGIVDCIFSAPEIYIPSRIHNNIFSEDVPIFVWKCPLCYDIFETNEVSSLCLTCRFSPMRLLDAVLS